MQSRPEHTRGLGLAINARFCEGPPRRRSRPEKSPRSKVRGGGEFQAPYNLLRGTLRHSFTPRYLSKEFFQGFPIVAFPSFGQVIRVPLGKSRVIKHNLRAGGLLDEFKSCNRVKTRGPVVHAPGLNDSLVRHQFYMPPQNVAPEKRKRAAYFTADFRWRSSRRRAGVHRRTELRDFAELICVGQRVEKAFAVCTEDGFLMNGFVRARNLLSGTSPGDAGAYSESGQCDAGAGDRLPARGHSSQLGPVELVDHCPLPN